MTASQIIEGSKPVRTVAQIEDNIRALTEQCMSGKKNDGWLNQTFSNAEQWRGTCEGYARGEASNPKSLQYELLQAQAREAQTKYAFDDAAAKLATGSSSNQTLYIMIGAGLAALVIYLLLA